MSSSNLTVEVWPATDAGQAEQNEDFVLVYQPADEEQTRYAGSLYIVADGLGGGERGRIASRYAAQKVMEVYYGMDEPDLGLRLRTAILAANADLYEYARQRPELVKMGTTIVAAAVRGEQLHVAAVGDSRAYLVREGAIVQITRDHTLVQQLLEEGAIAPDEAQGHPRRDVVLRLLGSEETVAVDLYDMRLRPDDSVLLCSDGLTRYLHQDEIAAVVASSAPRPAAETLVQKATDRGGKDNVTVVTLLVRDGGPPLVTDIPHTWDGAPASFDAQPTLAVPRAAVPAPEEAPAGTPEEAPAGTLDQTIRASRVTLEEAGAAPAPGGPVPAPPYQTPVQPAPAYVPPPAQQPPAQPPVQPPPPGYEIDPVTGLPPVPSPGAAQAGQPAGWQAQGHAPRVYQPPSQPALKPRPSRGISVGAFAAVGLIAVLLTVAMVVLLVNPLGWNLPFAGGLPAAPVATEEPTPEQAAEPTPVPPTPEPTPEVVAEPSPTPTSAPPGMVLIEGGAFLRGVGDEEAQAATLACINEAEDNTVCYPEYFSDAVPLENITLSPFFIDVTEVTNQAYAACVAADICSPPGNTEFYDDPAFAQHPVVYVNYDQATQYCEWLGKRLPTEAEWEKAARWDPVTGESYWFPWGSEYEVGRANTASAGLGGLAAVGSFARDLSPTGVLDMAGNATEWVQDWYFDSYNNLGTLNPARLGQQPLPEPFRVGRGGSFQALSAYARAGHRYDIPPNSSAAWLGFRCVMDLEGPPVEDAPVEDAAPAEDTEAPEATPAP